MPKPVQPGFTPFDYRLGHQIKRWRGVNYSGDLANLPPDQLAEGQNIRPSGGGYKERGGQTELLDFGDNGFVHETVTGMADLRNILGAPPGVEYVQSAPTVVSDTVYLYPVLDTDSVYNDMVTSVTGVSKASCLDDYYGALSDGDYIISKSLTTFSQQGVYLTNLPYDNWTITSLTVGVRACGDVRVGTETPLREFQIAFRVYNPLADQATEVLGIRIAIPAGVVYEVTELAPMTINPDTGVAWTQADLTYPQLTITEDTTGSGGPSMPLVGRTKIKYYQLYLKVVGTHS